MQHREESTLKRCIRNGPFRQFRWGNGNKIKVKCFLTASPSGSLSNINGIRRQVATTQADVSEKKKEKSSDWDENGQEWAYREITEGDVIAGSESQQRGNEDHVKCNHH